MLTAGVMEEGTFLPTYSGTPQGGLLTRGGFLKIRCDDFSPCGIL
jgi:hypothetical protein